MSGLHRPTPCPSCGKPRRARGQLCRSCSTAPVTRRCRCGNTFTPWLRLNGSATSHARKTCGLCWGKAIGSPSKRRPVLEEKPCRCCGEMFTGWPFERYCGPSCCRRFGDFLKRLARRFGVESSSELTEETIAAAWAMAGVHRAIQSKDDVLPRDRLGLKRRGGEGPCGFSTACG